jgi:signal transduction histidine kinase
MLPDRLKKSLRVLILEDVPADAELVERELRSAGVEFVSMRVDSQDSFREALDRFVPEIILADYLLPAFDGESALAIAREKVPTVPFIFVTGALGEERAVALLKSGATDFVLKDRLVRLPLCVKRALEEVEEKRQLQQAEQKLKESEKRLRYLSSQLLAAQENERKRIAGEIHDGLGQVLSSAKYKLQDAVQRVKEGILNRAVESLGTVDSMLQEAAEEARRIQLDLRPSILDDLGILAALSWFSRRFQATYPKIRVEQEIAIREEEVPESLKTVIYRISQEALNNISKHSKADFVHFGLRKTARIELFIQDNGRGFDLKEKLSLNSSKGGLGLGSMRERAELSGGSFAIESAVGKGTTIRVLWPLA